MKSKNTLLVLLGLTLCQCATPNYVLAPTGSVPVRNLLPQDVFGGYININTIDSTIVSGELIGVRNDSLVILSDSVKTIHHRHVAKARIIIHHPNNYKVAGVTLMGLSGLVMLQAGEFGEGPLALGISAILSNAIGLASAQGTENKKINYYNWSEGWNKVILYSRFPNGIPATINLSELRGRLK